MKRKKLESFQKFSESLDLNLSTLNGGNQIAEPTYVWSQFQSATMEGSCSDSYSYGTSDDGKCTVEGCTVNC